MFGFHVHYKAKSVTSLTLLLTWVTRNRRRLFNARLRFYLSINLLIFMHKNLYFRCRNTYIFFVILDESQQSAFYEFNFITVDDRLRSTQTRDTEIFSSVTEAVMSC